MSNTPCVFIITQKPKTFVPNALTHRYKLKIPNAIASQRAPTSRPQTPTVRRKRLNAAAHRPALPSLTCAPPVLTQVAVHPNDSLSASRPNFSSLISQISFAYRRPNDSLSAYRRWKPPTAPLPSPATSSTAATGTHTKAEQWCTSWWHQFKILLMRGLRQRRYDAFNRLLIFQVLTVAFLAGLLWWQTPTSHIANRVSTVLNKRISCRGTKCKKRYGWHY
nr:ABC transporter G family member 14 [Ipomoea batatas]